jgi:multiple sugar transport system permease protein
MVRSISGLRTDNLVLKIVNYCLLIIACVFILGPLLIVFNASFKSNDEYMKSALFQLPRSLDFTNYYTVLVRGGLLRGYINTVSIILVTIVGSILLGSMVAYVLTRFDFKLKKVLFNMFVISAVIPFVTVQVATFTVIKSLGLYNTIFAPMLLFLGADIVQIYIFLQFIEKVPRELDESGIIDGASYFRIYWSIILPQLKPAIATVTILKAVGIYNDFVIPFLYMPSVKLRTVSTFLFNYTSTQTSQWNLMSAAIILVMIPTLIIYLFLQKYIFAGVTEGAVKN